MTDKTELRDIIRREVVRAQYGTIGELTDNLYREISAQLSKFSETILADIEDYEKSFYRDGNGELMCATCSAEVFGGICNCSIRNKQNDKLRSHIKAISNTKKEGDPS